jgi:4-hydroxybenzoate polyprenyltransferase
VVFFCVASAAVYIFNDLQDIDKDRLHPEKRHTRPLAAGAISAAQGRNVLFLLYTILIAWTLARPGVGVVIAGYVAVNVAYTLWLKHRPPLDLFCLSSGFLLRVYAGAKAIAVDLSSWMFVTTLCLALYLAATKRRQELMTHGSAARSVLKKYTPALLDSYAQTSAVGALVFYGLFAATVRPALAITIPAVLFGLFRYRYITEMKGDGESPTDALWSDPSLIVTCVVWALCSLYAVAQAPTTSVQVLHP